MKFSKSSAERENDVYWTKSWLTVSLLERCLRWQGSSLDFKIVRFASDERFALDNLETFLKVSTVITGVIISFNKVN